GTRCPTPARRRPGAATWALWPMSLKGGHDGAETGNRRRRIRRGGGRVQPTDVQVQASLAALALEAVGAPGAVVAAERRAASGSEARVLPDGLLDAVAAAPSLREDRLAAARRRLAAGIVPTDEDLAGRMVGRIVCD